MISEIDKLKHFTDDLNDGEEFLYTTIGIKDEELRNNK